MSVAKRDRDKMIHNGATESTEENDDERECLC